MSFSVLSAFRQQRLVRASVGVLVLAAATLALYKLAHVARPVDLTAAGKFSPATIKLGEQELIIEGSVVNRDEGVLFSYDSGPNGIVEIGFDRASLSQETVEMFDDLNIKLPRNFVPIDYWVARTSNSTKGHQPCSTKIALKVAASDPPEIHLSQFDNPGPSRRRELQITASAELVARMQTDAPDDASALGCRKMLKVDKKTEYTSLPVTVRVAENSVIHLRFLPLSDSLPWGDQQGSVAVDLGGPPKLSETDAPPFQARSVSIRSFGDRTPTNARVILSARSEAGAPLLAISGLRVLSDQIQVSVAGKGWVEIDGVAQTVDFLKLLEGNRLISTLLGIAIGALLAWVARLVFKAPQSPPAAHGD